MQSQCPADAPSRRGRQHECFLPGEIMVSHQIGKDDIPLKGVESYLLAAGQDGLGDAMTVGRNQDQDVRFRRFLQRFQECVRRGRIHCFGSNDYADPLSPFKGPVLHLALQIPYILDFDEQAVGLYNRDIGMVATFDLCACPASFSSLQFRAFAKVSAVRRFPVPSIPWKR